MTTLTSTVEPAGTGERMLPLTGLPSTGMVVYGKDKPDEISLSAPTKVCEIKGNTA